jgi:hypothetical protein
LNLLGQARLIVQASAIADHKHVIGSPNCIYQHHRAPCIIERQYDRTSDRRSRASSNGNKAKC